MIVAVVAAAATSCESGGSGGVPLAVVTVNMANAVNVNGVGWEERVDRLAANIADNAIVPDIISLTESAAEWRCKFNSIAADDYDIIDRLLSRLRRVSSDYRVAYMVGQYGTVKTGVGVTNCFYFNGDTLLYNSARLENVTPASVTGLPEVAYNSRMIGPQIRRSFPLCGRGTNHLPLDELIDGAPQTVLCEQATPSGPAFAAVNNGPGGGETRVVASAARFRWRALTSTSSFDVVTVHPTSREESFHATPIDDFVTAVTGRFRDAAPFYPVVVLGDFNSLKTVPNTDWSGEAWPTGTRQVFGPDADVMVVSVGAGIGATPEHDLNVGSSFSLPTADPCRVEGVDVPGTFSDHCGLVVQFNPIR